MDPLPSGHTSRRWGCAIRHEDGRVILDPDPREADCHCTKAAVVAAWPDQPEAIRAGILAMVKAASK